MNTIIFYLLLLASLLAGSLYRWNVPPCTVSVLVSGSVNANGFRHINRIAACVDMSVPVQVPAER
jgi:hypothetical protein